MIKTGDILNDTYEIRERIGSGGGGIIFKAYHRRMRKVVAVKLIKDEIKGDLHNRAEVDIMKDLKNDYLPQVIDFVEDGSDVYTVMEFIEGKNFSQLISSGGKFTEIQVRKYALQLCEAVEYLHSHVPPIIHSDIKPANVMLTTQDNICLIDFNISMVADNGFANVKGGSTNFGAPEQFKRIINAPSEIDEFHEETRFINSEDDETEILLDDNSENCSTSQMRTKNIGRAYIDVRTDVYGIGTTLYYILTERVPVNSKPDFRGIKISQQMKDIISKAMNVNSSLRYKNVTEMKKALLNTDSHKTSKIALVVILCSAAVFAFAAVGIAVSILNKNDNESSKIEYDNTIMTTESVMTTLNSIEINDSEETTPEKEYGVLEYYDNGKVKCEKTKPDEYGNYQLRWYDPDGSADKREYYDSKDELYNVNLTIGGSWYEGELECTNNGYIVTVKREGRKYPYEKYVVDYSNDTRSSTKVIYCDENKNELLERTVKQIYNDDGSHTTTWYESNGEIHQIQYYYNDGSKKIEFYENGKLNAIRDVSFDGKETTKYYDENGNEKK